MKKILLILLCLVCFGCTNNNQKEEINEFIKTQSFNAIVEKLDKNIEDISMFPEKDNENAFVYLVQAIKANTSRFTKIELIDIYQKLQINYSFSFNTLNYTSVDYQNDLNFINNVIENN